MKNHTTAHTADDLLIKYVYIILLFQRKNEYSYTVGEGLRALPQTTKTWEYNDAAWSDLLTNFNGESITYDEIGNPLTIGSKELSWMGRQLQGISDGDNEIAYTYNGDGLRTSKTVNGETTNYYYNGSILAGQKTGDDTLVFMYDNNSDIFGFIYNDTEYYYIKNAQNDVIGITDKDGNVLIKYAYDAWGKVIAVTDKDGNEITESTDEPTNPSNDIDESVGEGLRALPQNNEDSVGVDDHIDPSNADETAIKPETNSFSEVDLQIAKIANLNPILYRSYYYDQETEWYYLKTRYYSPDMCRFINADGIIQTGQGMLDKNMFAYCGNNPINRLDDNGNFWKSVKKCFSKAWSKVKSWARNTFGAGFTIENHFPNYEKEHLGNYLSFFVTAKTGSKTKTTIYKKGNSSKPISVYAKGRSDDWLRSSAGLKVNINKLTVNLSLGLDDFGISGSYTNENAINTFGIKIDVTQLKIGFEYENSVKLNDNSYESFYSNISVTGWFLLATYCVLVGQDASQFFYQQQPAYN